MPKKCHSEGEMLESREAGLSDVRFSFDLEDSDQDSVHSSYCPESSSGNHIFYLMFTLYHH